MPESPMARKWCVEYGILKAPAAEKICKQMNIPVVRHINKYPFKTRY